MSVNRNPSTVGICIIICTVECLKIDCIPGIVYAYPFDLNQIVGLFAQHMKGYS